MLFLFFTAASRSMTAFRLAYDTGISLPLLHDLADYFKGVKNDLVDDFNLNTNIPIDPKVLTFQIPGGMLSNLLNQMKEMGVADKYPQLLEEIPRVRAELGYLPSGRFNRAAAEKIPRTSDRGWLYKCQHRRPAQLYFLPRGCQSLL